MILRLLALTLATPAIACPDHVTYATDPDPAIIGHIVYDNPVDVCPSPETLLDFETPYGTVTILLTVTANGSTMEPDIMEVWSLPQGVVAYPMRTVVPEWGADTITLRLWEGS